MHPSPDGPYHTTNAQRNSESTYSKNNWVKTDTGSTDRIGGPRCCVVSTRLVLSYWWCYNWGVGGRCQSWTGLIINRASTVVLLSFRWAVNLLICVLQPVRGQTKHCFIIYSSESSPFTKLTGHIRISATAKHRIALNKCPDVIKIQLSYKEIYIRITFIVFDSPFCIIDY